MTTESKPVASSTEDSIGYSLQDPVRFAIWNRFLKLGENQIKLFEEYSRLKGFVKARTALDSLNDLFTFIQISGIRIKNLRHYHNEQLKQFDKFQYFYFLPQLNKINQVVEINSEIIEVGQNGFSIQNYGNWIELCRLFIEVSGIAKFERQQNLPAELGYGAS